MGAIPSGSGQTGDGTAAMACVCPTLGRDSRLSTKSTGLPTIPSQSLQPLPQKREATDSILPLHGHRQGFAAADDRDELAAARNSRVQKIPLQHDEVRRVQRNDDRGVFTPLPFVNR